MNLSFWVLYCKKEVQKTFREKFSSILGNPVTAKEFQQEIHAWEAEGIHILLFSSTVHMVLKDHRELINDSNTHTHSVAVPHLAAGAYYL